MRQVNIHEAKTHLSRLADEAGAGETIILAKAGKPVAKLVALDSIAAQAEAPSVKEPPVVVDNILDSPHIDRRRFGFLDGKFNVPDDFDTAYQDEIIAMFEGRE